MTITTESMIIVAIVAVIVGLAALYVGRAKRRGQKCIGCPSGGQCDRCGKC